MTTRIASTNIQSNTILTTNLASSTIAALQGSTVPTITQIQITTSGYVVKDDTAVSTSGGYIKITGTNFTAGSQVVIGSTPATSVGFVNSTTLNVQVPPLAAGTYVVYVTINTGSVAIMVNGLTYSGDPAWVTGSTLTSGQVDSAISIQLSATGDAPVTYALQAGSSLPAGLTLTSGGLLSGTVTGITVETTYNFTIEAIDAQAQESPRTFSITITASDQFFEYVTTLLSASNPSSTFVSDASTNNFAVSVFGDTRPNNFGPYTPGYYSGYFDGTGDYLTVPYNTTAFNWWTSNYTLEAWIYPTTLTGWYYIDGGTVNKGTIVGNNAFNSTSNYWSLGLNSSGNLWFAYYTGANQGAGTSNAVTLNTWNHIALVVNGSNITLYLNGVGTSLGNIVGTPLSGAELPLTIGAGNNAYVNGYISNLRIVKGTAVYTSNFTPPTSPLTSIANTSLLICQSNRFIDNSTNNFTVTRNGDTLISGFDPFTPLSAYSTYGSGYFDGTGDYLSLPAGQANLQPGSGNFTIEFWYNIATAPGGYINLFSYGSVGTNLRLFFFTTNSFTLFDGGNLLITANNAVVINAWNHVAVVRNSTTITLFVNGVSVGTASNSTNFVGSLNIGFESGQTPYTGYMVDFRLVKGTAVYTSAFTPPTAPLTAITNTQLLTLQNNQPNNNSMFLDSSTNNFLITRNGNTTQGSFSPYGGGWSNYFDGTGDYLSVANNSAFNLGTNNFTIEFWVYPTLLSGNQWILGKGDASTVAGSAFSFVINNTYDFYYNGSSTLSLTRPLLVANTWQHVAIVRNTTTVTIYLNGTSVSSGSIGAGSINTVSNPISIGYYASGGLVGYMSNFRLVNGTAIYTSNFTPPTAPLTPIANTSLLTCADNRFIDDSGNNFTITRNGDVSIQRFNPFNPVLTTPTSYSGYFDGTGDYLNFTGYALGSGNFTIEAWVYLTSLPNAANALYSNGTSDSVSAISAAAYVSSGGNLGFYNYPTATTTSSTISLSTWTHVAIVRNSGTITLYINGVSGATVSNSNNISDTAVQIMRGFGGITSSPVGYMSNLRVVVGTAVYTSNFTPSTTPLTAIANTRLLTLQNATFIDNSTNNYTITSNGDSVPRQFNPFGWTSSTGSNAAYSITNYGGSMYFDGTGDFLSASGSVSLSGQFTAQCWFYNTSSSGAQQTLFVFNSVSGNGYGSLRADCDQGNVQFNFSVNLSTNGTGWTSTISTNSIYVKNQWNHFAVTRDSNNLVRVFLNGVLINSATVSGALYSASTTHAIGCNNLPGTATNPFNGYISNLQLVNGTALYTSNFAPPVAPLSFNANAVLQVNGTGAAIYDSSMITTYETLGNASSTGVIKKYGNSSMSFDGTGDYLVSPFSVNNNLGTRSFTFEAWLYPSSIAGIRGFYALSGGAGGVPKFVIHLNAGTPSIHYNGLTGGSDIYTTATSAITANTWTHLAFVRNGSTWTWYINGVASGTGSNSTNITFTTQPLYVGYGGESYFTEFNGYIDDLRVTNGVARYTANFTPPTSPVIQF